MITNQMSRDLTVKQQHLFICQYRKKQLFVRYINRFIHIHFTIVNLKSKSILNTSHTLNKGWRLKVNNKYLSSTAPQKMLNTITVQWLFNQCFLKFLKLFFNRLLPFLESNQIINRETEWVQKIPLTIRLNFCH